MVSQYVVDAAGAYIILEHAYRALQGHARSLRERGASIAGIGRIVDQFRAVDRLASMLDVAPREAADLLHAWGYCLRKGSWVQEGTDEQRVRMLIDLSERLRMDALDADGREPTEEDWVRAVERVLDQTG